MLSVSIGICVYNEEKNIGKLLQALSNQKTKSVSIKEIIVVSSACTDRTEEIVKEFSKKDKMVKFITQEKREGKASAVNEFLKNAIGDICVLESGDTIPMENTIEKLCKPFLNPKVGMTGGRPIPVNDKSNFIGFGGHLIWDLHHKLALKDPKLGELIAFRKVVKEIPEDTAVDEAHIESIIRQKGYDLKYVPNAICYNKAPETILDFLKQRRRIYAGHLHLRKETGYAPSSMKFFNIFSLIMTSVKGSKKELIFALGAMILEGLGRLLGLLDFYTKKKPYVWEIAKTTKELGGEYENKI
jgi:cellulose synthase/poly-beta-1,6-N-acetylglucosamine synthase-like glycosyltransferase